jgi:F-type H+-transporting ATPase subunit b
MRSNRVAATGGLAAFLVVTDAGLVWAQAEDGEGEPEFADHAAEECAHLLEEGGTVDDCQEAPNPILPETNEIIWGGLSFLILFVLLAKFAFPAVKKAMDERSDRIRQSIDDAERQKAEAQQVLDDYQRQLGDARSEAGRIIEEARQSADAMRRELQAKAEAGAAEIRQKAQADVDAMVAQARADLQTRVAEMSIQLAERVVERSLDRESNLRLIDNYIRELETQRS